MRGVPQEDRREKRQTFVNVVNYVVVSSLAIRYHPGGGCCRRFHTSRNTLLYVTYVAKPPSTHKYATRLMLRLSSS